MKTPSISGSGSGSVSSSNVSLWWCFKICPLPPSISSVTMHSNGSNLTLTLGVGIPLNGLMIFFTYCVITISSYLTFCSMNWLTMCSLKHIKTNWVNWATFIWGKLVRCHAPCRAQVSQVIQVIHRIEDTTTLEWDNLNTQGLSVCQQFVYMLRVNKQPVVTTVHRWLNTVNHKTVTTFSPLKLRYLWRWLQRTIDCQIVQIVVIFFFFLQILKIYC